MDAGSPVILDACVLAPFSVCDLLLRLAEEPRLYMPRWSEEILFEVHRTQVGKLDWPVTLADYWKQEVTASFPEALVTDYEGLLSRCTNDEKDRHVLAAALRSAASTIVTFNERHFPADSTTPHAIEVLHPSQFLLDLYRTAGDGVVARLQDIAERRGIEPAAVLTRLRNSLPSFVEQVAADRGWKL